MQVRYDDFKRRIATIPIRGSVHQHVANMMGLSYPTFMSKLNGHRPWVKDERDRLLAIIELLERQAARNPVREKMNKIR